MLTKNILKGIWNNPCVNNMQLFNSELLENLQLLARIPCTVSTTSNSSSAQGFSSFNMTTSPYRSTVRLKVLFTQYRLFGCCYAHLSCNGKQMWNINSECWYMSTTMQQWAWRSTKILDHQLCYLAAGQSELLSDTLGMDECFRRHGICLHGDSWTIQAPPLCNCPIWTFGAWTVSVHRHLPRTIW